MNQKGQQIDGDIPHLDAEYTSFVPHQPGNTSPKGGIPKQKGERPDRHRIFLGGSCVTFPSTPFMLVARPGHTAGTTTPRTTLNPLGSDTSTAVYHGTGYRIYTDIWHATGRGLEDLQP